MLVLWITRVLIPGLFLRFDSALQAFRDEMAAERENHKPMTQAVTSKIEELIRTRRVI